MSNFVFISLYQLLTLKKKVTFRQPFSRPGPNDPYMCTKISVEWCTQVSPSPPTHTHTYTQSTKLKVHSTLLNKYMKMDISMSKMLMKLNPRG